MSNKIVCYWNEQSPYYPFMSKRFHYHVFQWIRATQLTHTANVQCSFTTVCCTRVCSVYVEIFFENNFKIAWAHQHGIPFENSIGNSYAKMAIQDSIEWKTVKIKYVKHWVNIRCVCVCVWVVGCHCCSGIGYIVYCISLNRKYSVVKWMWISNRILNAEKHTTKQLYNIVVATAISTEGVLRLWNIDKTKVRRYFIKYECHNGAMCPIILSALKLSQNTREEEGEKECEYDLVKMKEAETWNMEWLWKCSKVPYSSWLMAHGSILSFPFSVCTRLLLFVRFIFIRTQSIWFNLCSLWYFNYRYFNVYIFHVE